MIQPVGTEPPSNLPAPTVKDHRLLRRHVHRQVHPRDRRRLDLEVHPAPVHTPVLGLHTLNHQNSRTLVHLEKPSALQGGFVRPMSCV